MSKENKSIKVIKNVDFQDSAPLSKIKVTQPKKESAPPSRVKPKPSK
ncbi:MULTISPECIES: hypothetical protein [unclassified Francisella]|nr:MULTISPECIES: hypothetical protein [unclassified Francisella]MED7818649.1 hypothetical protein [Francisella sp. 19S2-4]MED7829485.1 hypothetical protein [Francisella sp. 19S2-10]